jgi:glycogen(starch) synthase
MLSWEYPPVIVGGLGRHVYALSRELVAAGHDVCVVTRGGVDLPDEMHEGVRVRRAEVDPVRIDFTTESLLAWTQAFEHGLLRAALPVVRRWRPDVIHAHDWLVTQSAVTLAQTTSRPIVATFHATEVGRHQGWLPGPLNQAVHSVERWLAHEAVRVITCSTFMHDEVSRRFEVPAEHVAVVPIGLDADAWRAPARARMIARARFAGQGPLLVIAARLVHEKGVHVALAAMPRLRREFPGIRLVVAGTGPQAGELYAAARRLGDAVHWAGFVPDRDLAALLGAADAVLVPSLYEPFGLIALEAAAAGAPLALADTGGLRDLTFAGARFRPDDPVALATSVADLLCDGSVARRATARAQRQVRSGYTWRAVAERTASLYADVASRVHGAERVRITRAGAPTATP